MRRTLLTYSIVTSLLLSPAVLRAACAAPAGVEGETMYNTDYATMQFCDGTNWISMAASGSITAEQDPKVGTLTPSTYCKANAGGTQITCGTTMISLTTEASGVLQAAQFPTLTGDITTVAGSLATSIATGAVTIAKIAATGTPSATTYLRGDGIWTSQWQDATVGTMSVLYRNFGNVGIGTSAPGTKLDLNGALTLRGFAGPAAPLSPSGQARLYFDNISNTLKISQNGSAYADLNTGGIAAGASGQLQFNASGVLAADGALVWDNSSKSLGIGTAAPDYKLTIQSGDAAISFKDSSGITHAYLGVAGVDGSAATNALRIRGDSGIMLSVGGFPVATIDTARNVGVGTTAPETALHIARSSGEAAIRLTNPSSNFWDLWNAAGDSNLYFNYNGAVKMTVTKAGNVGIGTATPSEKLTVNGNIFTQGGLFRSAMPGSAGATGSVCYSGSGYFDACTSLRAHKTNIRDLDDGLEVALRLRPVSYAWKANNERDIGFIAEEAVLIDPRFGQKGTDGRLNGIKYDHMVAVAIKAVQQLKAENDNLRVELLTIEANQQAQIKALQHKIDALKTAR